MGALRDTPTVPHRARDIDLSYREALKGAVRGGRLEARPQEVHTSQGLKVGYVTSNGVRNGLIRGNISSFLIFFFWGGDYPSSN